MNHFVKTNSLWLSFLGLAVIIVVLTFLFRPLSAHYQTNAKESITLMNDPTTEIELKDLSGKQLIDIRQEELYSQGHPLNAINIPIRQLLHKESLQLFDNLQKNNKEAVLYGNTELQATAPVFLLRQLGYKNLKLLKGGINPTNEFIPPAPAMTEVSVVDTSSIHQKTEQTQIAPTIQKKGEAVIPVRKGASAGGGC